MEKPILYRMGIISAVIFLFFCIRVFQSTGIRVEKKSNLVAYSENSTLCGFITDFETVEPIFNASVIMQWFDIHGQLTYNGSDTDDNCYYSMNFGVQIW